jgi:hypothetical protein
VAGSPVTFDDEKTHAPPTTTFRKRTPAEAYSALALRAFALADRLAARDGGEPKKPSSRINWPAHVNEADPGARVVGSVLA